MKIGKYIESRPINFFGAIGLFFFILFAEMVFGGIFYNLAIKNYGANLWMASCVINGGLIITKGIILFSLMRLVFYRKEEPAARKENFGWTKAIKSVLMIGLIILLYRMAFDSLVATLLMDWFGTSEDLNWSMRLILGAPILGYGYIFIIAPIFEEIIYRGILYDGLRKSGHRALSASVISALLFAVMHFNVVQGVNAFVLGLLTAYLYERSQKLIVPVVFHILNNIYVTLFSALIMNLQWLNLPLRIGIMVASVTALGLLLKYGSKINIEEKKASQN